MPNCSSPRSLQARRTLHAAPLTPQGITDDLRRLATVVTPQLAPPIVTRDPDDDHVLACALAGSADLIVSGDRALLRLASYHSIPILAPRAAIEHVAR